MAQKKITDLQQISSVTDGLNYLVDNGIQTYRATALQLKNYMLAAGNISLSMLNATIFNGLTSVTPADDDYFPIVDTSDSNNTKKALVGNFVRNVANVGPTLPYSITDSDGLIVLTGSTGTATLPTAVGKAGKVYRIVHGGTSLSNVYTLNTTSSQTIGGYSSGNVKLYTNGEVFELASDGSNWVIVSHFAETAPAQYTATTQGFGTLSNYWAQWYRKGQMLFVDARYAVGSVSGSEARFYFPTNCPVSQAIGKNDVMCGFGGRSGASGPTNVLLQDSVGYFNFSNGTSGVNAMTGNNVLGSSEIMTFFAKAPITGWLP